jgi:hypothetical protein
MVIFHMTFYTKIKLWFKKKKKKVSPKLSNSNGLQIFLSKDPF